LDDRPDIAATTHRALLLEHQVRQRLRQIDRRLAAIDDRRTWSPIRA
jgi:hypothetical protein